ncbi:MAG TPA: GFA family protein [Gammaproteobacteria bacterium]|nr:GFA family protein [Gammaproteobacteria bacterium]
MSEETTTGSCLCGKVAYAFIGPVQVFQYCHCSRCRKFTGAAFAPNIIIEPQQLEWLRGEKHVGHYDLPEAKHFATAFCRLCGSSLPWLTQSRKAVVIPAGTLDGDPGVRPQHNIFCADRAAWFDDVEGLIKYEALPVKGG